MAVGFRVPHGHDFGVGAAGALGVALAKNLALGRA